MSAIACPYCNELQDSKQIKSIMDITSKTNGKFICVDCGSTYVVIKEIDGTLTSLEDSDVGTVDSTL